MMPRLSRPRLMSLWHVSSLCRMFREIYLLEGYVIEAAKTADEAISLLERAAGPCIVLMDNFMVNPEAFRLVTRLP